MVLAPVVPSAEVRIPPFLLGLSCRRFNLSRAKGSSTVPAPCLFMPAHCASALAHCPAPDSRQTMRWREARRES
ncbi:hypothetical protein BKA56DRAFT_587138 [Ilyonectria sp. MPI-CAGE-AT-0026]|nr:hypothetical protein BKA56DRAFT_587138 [Ilyonectria sp. MPI-CAGE-AT-0026]